MPSQRLLVIKHGALGDIIQGMDAYASLRAGYPQAHIAVLTTPPFAGLFAAMPWFDEVVIDHRAAVGNLRQMFRIRTLLHRGWSQVVDLQCSNRTQTYQRFLAPHDLRWVGTAPGASDRLPDLSGVNNVRRMTMAAEMAGDRSAGCCVSPAIWRGHLCWCRAVHRPSRANAGQPRVSRRLPIWPWLRAGMW